MRVQFDEQLQELKTNLIRMGSLCEKSILTSCQALQLKMPNLTNTNKEIYQEVKQLRMKTESLCMQIILQQQPVAKDLRQVSASLKIVTDLERITEQNVDIHRIVSFLNEETLTGYEKIVEMSQSVVQMVSESVNAYAKQNVVIANKVIIDDDIVDNKFKEIKKDLIQVIAQNPERGEYALDLFMIAKYFEGMADHAVHIAKWVKFSVNGYKISDIEQVEVFV